MNTFCSSLQGEDIQTALVLGHGYLRRHSASWRSHSHNLCAHIPHSLHVSCSIAVNKNKSMYSSWSKEIYRVLIYTLPHYNKFQSLRSSSRVLSSVALAIKFHISDTSTFITPVKSCAGSCVPDCSVTYWSHNFDSKFIGWITKKSCSTPSRGKRFFVSWKFGTWPPTQWALGSFSQGQIGQGVKLTTHF